MLDVRDGNFMTLKVSRYGSHERTVGQMLSSAVFTTADDGGSSGFPRHGKTPLRWQHCGSIVRMFLCFRFGHACAWYRIV